MEYYSVIRSIRSIENSDVCILMLDASRGIEGQDLNIFSLIQRNQKGLVVVVNKWDLVENKDAKVMKTYEEAIRSRLAPFVDFPIIFASALTKQRIFKVLETAKEVYQARTTRIPTARLNEEMLPLIELIRLLQIRVSISRLNIVRSYQTRRFLLLCSLLICLNT